MTDKKRKVWYRDTGIHFILIYVHIKNKGKVRGIIFVYKWHWRGVQHMVEHTDLR